MNETNQIFMKKTSLITLVCYFCLQFSFSQSIEVTIQPHGKDATKILPKSWVLIFNAANQLTDSLSVNSKEGIKIKLDFDNNYKLIVSECEHFPSIIYFNSSASEEDKKYSYDKNINLQLAPREKGSFYKKITNPNPGEEVDINTFQVQHNYGFNSKKLNYSELAGTGVYVEKTNSNSSNYFASSKDIPKHLLLGCNQKLTKDAHFLTMVGALFSDIGLSKPVVNQEVLLMEGTEIKERTITNYKGEFQFEQVERKSKNLSIKVNNKELEQLFLTDRDKIVITKLAKKGDSFDYTLLPPIIETLAKLETDDPDEKTIAGQLLNGENNAPVANATIDFISNNKVEASTTTDANGNFKQKINGTVSSNFTMEVKPIEQISELILVNTNGVEVSRMMSKGDNRFEFTFLNAMVNTLELMPQKDVDLIFTNDLKYLELTLNYNANSVEFMESDIAVINKLIQFLKANPGKTVEVISHSDAVGDNAYNLELSIKRATYVKSYLENQLNGAATIEAKGKGESEIRNRCKDGVTCSDQEHSYNRRTEFNIK